MCQVNYKELTQCVLRKQPFDLIVCKHSFPYHISLLLSEVISPYSVSNSDGNLLRSVTGHIVCLYGTMHIYGAVLNNQVQPWVLRSMKISAVYFQWNRFLLSTQNGVFYSIIRTSHCILCIIWNRKYFTIAACFFQHPNLLQNNGENNCGHFSGTLEFKWQIFCVIHYIISFCYMVVLTQMD